MRDMIPHWRKKTYLCQPLELYAAETKLSTENCSCWRWLREGIFACVTGLCISTLWLCCVSSGKKKLAKNTVLVIKNCSERFKCWSQLELSRTSLNYTKYNISLREGGVGWGVLLTFGTWLIARSKLLSLFSTVNVQFVTWVDRFLLLLMMREQQGCITEIIEIRVGEGMETKSNSQSIRALSQLSTSAKFAWCHHVLLSHCI